jgi:hypothetical protein
MTDFGTYTPLDDSDYLVVKTINSAPKHSPIFTVHRTITAIDASAITTRNWGMVMAGFEKAIIKVVPTATADVDIEAMFWSNSASKFIVANPRLQATGLGAGVGYDYTVDVNGRRLFVYVTGTIGTGVEIQVAGFGVMPEP